MGREVSFAISRNRV